MCKNQKKRKWNEKAFFLPWWQYEKGLYDTNGRLSFIFRMQTLLKGKME